MTIVIQVKLFAMREHSGQRGTDNELLLDEKCPVVKISVVYYIDLACKKMVAFSSHSTASWEI